MQRHRQAVSITTNLRVKIDFILPELSAKKVVTWDFCVDESDKGRYDMILGRDIFTSLGLNLKFSDHIIETDDGPFKGYTAPMIDMGKYYFKYLNTEDITSLQMRTQNKYMNCNKSVLLLNNYM